MAYSLASQTLRLQSSTETTGIKHPAPVLPLVAWTHRSPFTSPHPAVHSFHTITGPTGVGSRPRMRRQDCPPLTRDRDRSLTLTSPLFLGGEAGPQAAAAAAFCVTPTARQNGSFPAPARPILGLDPFPAHYACAKRGPTPATTQAP